MIPQPNIIPLPMPTESFIPPTLAEVILNGAKMGMPETECKKFWFFYDAKGWMVGKSKMKRWHSAQSGWFLRWQEQGGLKMTPKLTPSIPTRDDVYAYARDKGDTNGFCIRWYDSWARRNFQLAGRNIDWKIEFSKAFATQRV